MMVMFSHVQCARAIQYIKTPAMVPSREAMAPALASDVLTAGALTIESGAREWPQSDIGGRARGNEILPSGNVVLN